MLFHDRNEIGHWRSPRFEITDLFMAWLLFQIVFPFSLSLFLCSTITFFSHEESSRIRGKRCFHFAIDSLDTDYLLSGIGLSIVHGEGSSTWDIPLNAFPRVRFLRSKSKKFLYNVWKGILFLFHFILPLFISLCSFVE